MSNPGQTFIIGQLQGVSALSWKLYLTGVEGGTGTTIADLQSDLQDVTRGDYSPAISTSAQAFRASLAALLGTNLSTMLLPVLQNEGIRLGLVPTTNPALLNAIYDAWKVSGDAVDSRELVFGPASLDGGNTGDGTIARVSVNRYGDAMESCFIPKATTLTATCNIDGGLGGALPGQEQFLLRSDVRGIDAFAPRSSGIETQLTGATITDSQNQGLNNATFSTVTPTTNSGTVTQLPGWTVATGSLGLLRTYTGGTSYYYRAAPNDTTPRSLGFAGNVSLSAPLRNLTQAQPYVVQLAYRRKGSATGIITLAVGSVSATTTVTSGSMWGTLQIPLDENSWAYNWDAATINLVVSVASFTGSSPAAILIDDVIVAPMTQSDSLFYRPVGGPTRFVLNDTVRFTDEQGADAIIQTNTVRATGFTQFLPARAPASQVTAAGGRTMTFATAGDTITMSSGDLTTEGYYAGMKLTVAGTSSNNGTYTIESVAATVIAVVENLSNEGPLSATATLNARASYPDPTVT